MREILLKLAEKITGKPRYHPEQYEKDKKLRWSKDIWVLNIFRAYEYLFGREYGIRAEARAFSFEKNGKLYVYQEFFTPEALLAHIEVTFRIYLRLFTTIFTPQPNLNYRPAYLTLGLLGLFLTIHTNEKYLPLFGLAIAYDTSDGTHIASSSSSSFSYTVTGSNPFLAVTHGGDTSGAAVLSSATYNSVSMTNANVNGTGAGGSNKKTGIMYLAAPATGANTLAVTYSTTFTNTAVTGAISLSGVAQSSPVDTGSGSSAPASSTTQSLTNSAAAGAEWQVSVVTMGKQTATASTNQNTRWSNTGNTFSNFYGGAAALAGSGSQVVAWTTGSSVTWAMSVIYVKPAAVPTTQTHTTDSLKKKIDNLLTQTVDALLKKFSTKTHTTDAFLIYSIGKPVWVTPLNHATLVTPQTPLVFTLPASGLPMHFELELDTVNTFNGTDYQDIKSWQNQTRWEYWDGSAWQPFPALGVDPSYAGNNARYTPTALSQTTWYRRIRGRIARTS